MNKVNAFPGLGGRIESNDLLLEGGVKGESDFTAGISTMVQDRIGSSSGPVQ